MELVLSLRGVHCSLELRHGPGQPRGLHHLRDPPRGSQCRHQASLGHRHRCADLWYPGTDIYQYGRVYEDLGPGDAKVLAGVLLGPGRWFLTAIGRSQDRIHAERIQPLHSSLFQRFLCLKRILDLFTLENVERIHACIFIYFIESKQRMRKKEHIQN